MKKIQNDVTLILLLLNIIFTNFTIADLPIHVEIKHLVGKWKIFKTETSTIISSCEAKMPNNNIDNIKIKDYKSHLLHNNYKFVSELNVILSDDYVLYGDLFDTKNNEHRRNWKLLAVYNENNDIIGMWTTIYNEGFELRIGNEVYTALMHYEPTGKCPEISNSDSLDSNGETECYVTNYNKIRFGWVDISNKDQNRLFGCFYAEKVNKTTEDLYSYELEDINEKYVNDHLKEKHNDLIEKGNSEKSGSYSDSDTFLFDNKEYRNHVYKKDNENKNNDETPTFSKKEKVDYDENTELSWHKKKHGGKKKALNKILGANLKQKYACPCNSNESEQNERSKSKSLNVVSPSDIDLYHIYKWNNNFLEIDGTDNGYDLDNYEHTVDTPKRELEIYELPKSFTWGDPYNNNMREYDVLNQLSCGSCYIASLLYTFKRRIEISLTKKFQKKYLNDFDDNLSIQYILSCSFYDQGCYGGYPLLASKVAKLQGIPLDKFLPYTAHDQTCPYTIQGSFNELNKLNNGFGKLKEIKVVSNYDQGRELSGEHPGDDPINLESNRWYAKDYNYVGGCYGCNQCNGEKIMMNELYRNGPIVSSFEVTQDIYNYEDGIYYIKDYPHAKKCTINTKNLKVFNITGWERVNHAIVIVGWGEEYIDGKKYKYWVARNSWGRKWGREGYFKIIRGINFNGIESEPFYIEPDFTRGAGKFILNKLKKELEN